MRFAERLNTVTHASETRLIAIVAGEPASPHVASCAACQARLEGLRAWTADVSTEAVAVADEVFTADRLAAQRARILKRLEAAGRQARVITFPAGAAIPSVSSTARVFRWAAAAALGGLMVGLGAGVLFINLGDRTASPASATTSVSAPAPAAVPLSAIVASQTPAGEELDEEGLLNAAYERVDVDALRTIDDITPRAREVAVNLPRRPLP
ncbi:MAG: hypothetical protein H0X44_06405 [Acidobacteria bacterium]|nr:hypothetical protein [Acidobacteriota bacterium]